MKTHTIICGAGIAGIATAYYLSVKQKHTDVVLVDKLMPMSLTTANSGENYRDYWPQPMMTDFVSRSIALMQQIESQLDNHGFTMHKIGYDFVSEQAAAIFPSSYADSSVNNSTDYLDVIQCDDKIRSSRPYLAESINQVVHVKSAGEMDVYALGSFMLREAKRAGVTFIRHDILGIASDANSGFSLITDKGADKLNCKNLVLAAGPFCSDLADKLGISLPLKNYLQHKFLIPDPENAIPKDMPFTIFTDGQILNWNDDERSLLSESPEFAHLLDAFPAGLHIKPEGKNHIKMGWAYNRQAEQAHWQPQIKSEFVDIVMRGASRFIPSLAPYIDKLPAPLTQYSGYYTRTPDNLPLIGPTQVDGVFVVSGLSGFGTMSACAAGELIANIMCKDTLPQYAKYFSPDRYNNAELMSEISRIDNDGQL